jgi:hypothetical protein
VLVVDGGNVVVVGASVVVVVDSVVVVVGASVVVVVGASVVVVVDSVVVVVGASVVVVVDSVVVVVGASVVVVVGASVVVVVGASVVVVVGASVVVVTPATFVVVSVFGGMLHVTASGVPGGVDPMLAVVVSCVALTVAVLGPTGAWTSTVTSGVVRSPGAMGPGSANAIVVLPLPSVTFSVIGVPLFVVCPATVMLPGTNVALPKVYVLERLLYVWMVTLPPRAVLGSVAEPPGNVTGNTALLATSVGASSENVTVCV